MKDLKEIELRMEELAPDCVPSDHYSRAKHEEFFKLQSQRRELQKKAKTPRHATVQTSVSNYTPQREITSGTYKRAFARQTKEIDRMFKNR